MAKKSYAIGVDFGGTKVIAAVVDTTKGKVKGEFKIATSAFDTGDALMERIYEVVDGALADAKVAIEDCAGIGVRPLQWQQLMHFLIPGRPKKQQQRAKVE